MGTPSLIFRVLRTLIDLSSLVLQTIGSRVWTLVGLNGKYPCSMDGAVLIDQDIVGGLECI